MIHSKEMKRKPFVLMTSGAREYSGHLYQVLGKKYMDPVVSVSNCLPIIYPTAFGTDGIEQYLSMVDGVFCSGASSNIDPAAYNESWLTPDVIQDQGRDSVDFALIKMALEMGIPILGVCRGFQEMNVAFGGSLHQIVSDVDGLMDHREPRGSEGEELELSLQYGANHMVRLVPGTWFSALMGQDEFMVNSLHGQGIKTLATGLKALAHAPDGLVEALTFEVSPQFTLGVQWHPEWKTLDNPFFMKIFEAFGNACYKYAQASHR